MLISWGTIWEHLDWWPSAHLFYFWSYVTRRGLESPLDSKELKPDNPKGNQSWILIGRTDAETNASIPWSHIAKNWHIGKDSEGKRRRRVAERWLDSITDSMDMNLCKLWQIVEERGDWCIAVHGVTQSGYDLVTEQQNPHFNIITSLKILLPNTVIF